MSDIDGVAGRWLVKSMKSQLWVSRHGGFTTQLKAAKRFSQAGATEIVNAYNRADNRFEVVLAPEFAEDEMWMRRLKEYHAAYKEAQRVGALHVPSMPVAVTEKMLKAGYDKLKELDARICMLDENNVRYDLAEAFKAMFAAMRADTAVTKE